MHLRDNEGLTLVSVSHDPSTAAQADNIVVMRAGGTVGKLCVKDSMNSGTFTVKHSRAVL